MGAKPLILVTGSNGQLGKELKRLEARYPQFEFLFLSREDMPVHHFEMVRHYFSVYKPDYVINCAAYTAVDRAESEKDNAFRVNGEAVGVLATLCREYDSKLVHISTDYVFDGTATKPYKEDDPVNPQSIYGASKLEGEKHAMQLNPDTLVIRSSWLYSRYGKNFVKTMRKLMSEKEEIHVVNDQVGSPTYAADLAEVILQIIQSGKWVPGIYHFSNEGQVSWYDFAVAIREQTGSSCRIHGIPSASYPVAAKRPFFSVLDKSKICITYGIQLHGWKERLKSCLKQMK